MSFIIQNTRAISRPNRALRGCGVRLCRVWPAAILNADGLPDRPHGTGSRTSFMKQVIWHVPIPGLKDGIPLYGYGLMLFLAFLACYSVAGWRAKRVGIGKEVIQDLAIWLFLGGLIGARVTFLLLQGNVRNLWDFIKQLPRLWDGGVIFYGAAIGGLIAFALAYWFLLRKHHLATWKVLDIIAPAVAIGLAVGRIGC